MSGDTERKQTRLRIVVTGGGSGGHITPILAVAHRLKVLRPGCEIIYIGQTGDSLGDIPAQDPHIDAVYTVRAGKLRRYHGEGLRQLLDVPTVAKNIRDVGFVVAGLGQSYKLLRRLKPDVVFIKGGFVGVPVGLAAARLGIPYITHDSDALPGLANRLIAPWAAKHAVALPAEVYKYPADRTVTVGVPVSHHFEPLDEAGLAAARQRIGLQPGQRAVLVTGGGLGAHRLNTAVLSSAHALLSCYAEVVLYHMSGRSLQTELEKSYDEAMEKKNRPRVRVIGFATNLYDYSAAADVVITRAGGTSMAEFAVQAKACIVVPNPQLTGGHQSKNAQILSERQAARVVSEPELLHTPAALWPVIRELLDDDSARQQLGARLHTLAQPDAARKLAMLLLEEADKRR